MKIYGCADVHHGIREPKMQEVFERNLNDVLEEIYNQEDEECIFLIAGDFFDNPTNTHKVIDSFFKIIGKYKDRIKVIIGSGNHDSSPVNDHATLNVLEAREYFDAEPVYSSDTLELYVYEDFKSLPVLNIAVSKYKRFIIESEKMIIDVLPYYMNTQPFVLTKEEKELFNRPDYKNILVCHGVTEENEIFKANEVIDKSYLKKRDFILKGHIHKTFSEVLYGAVLYSPGALNNDSAKSEGCYLEIYDSNSTKLKEKPLTSDFGESAEVTDEIDYFTCKQLLPKEENVISYKTFPSESNETINDTLRSLKPNDVVNITYFGDMETIDSAEFSRCYSECIQFRLTFGNLDLDVLNYANNNVNSLEFIRFHDFMKATLQKMKKDSNIAAIEKAYNKMTIFARKENK